MERWSQTVQFKRDLVHALQDSYTPYPSDLVVDHGGCVYHVSERRAQSKMLSRWTDEVVVAVQLSTTEKKIGTLDDVVVQSIFR